MLTLVLLAGAAVLHVRASHDLAATNTQLTDARNELATVADQLASLETAVDDAARLRDNKQAQADHVIDTVNQLAALADQMEATRQSLAATQDDVTQIKGDVRALESCLTTLNTARTDLESADADAARSILRSGSTTCQQAAAIAGRSGVYPYDFADPFVFVADGTYLAVGTNGAAGTVQVLSSSDERNWRLVGDALPSLPAWAESGRTWSPAVTATSGGYLLYYTARDRASGKQCISVGVSTQPQGPYLDLSSAPLICQISLGGSIDASPYRAADGTPYLTWKSEGEIVAGRSEIWAQQLTTDGGNMVGEPAVLLRADRSWESGVIEGPSMMLTADGWILLYSGNSWTSSAYTSGFATCSGPLGPCIKPAHNEVLGSSVSYAGPGGAEWFVNAAGALSVSFAAWDADAVGYPNPRLLHLTRVLSISASKVVLGQ